MFIPLPISLTDSDLATKPQALEPYISAEIMVLHHSKHHQAYVNGLNAAEEAYVKAPSTRERIALQAALKFNGGGEYMVQVPPTPPVIVRLLAS